MTANGSLSDLYINSRTKGGGKRAGVARWRAGLVGAAMREDATQHLVGGSIELNLELARCAASLLHQRGIEEKGHAVDERADGGRAAGARRGAAKLARREIFVEFEVAPEFAGVFIAPLESLTQSDEKFLAEEVEERDRELHRGAFLDTFLAGRGARFIARLFFFLWAFGAAHRHRNFKARRQGRLDAKHGGENCFAANHLELVAIKCRLIGATGPSVFSRVHVQKPADHFIAIKSGE